MVTFSYAACLTYITGDGAFGILERASRRKSRTPWHPVSRSKVSHSIIIPWL